MSRKHSREDDVYDDRYTQKRYKYEGRSFRRRHSCSPRRNGYHQKGRQRSYQRRDDYNRSPYYSDKRRSGKKSSESYHSNTSSIDDEVGHYFGEVGDVIDGRYEIKEVLGKGTFGKVFKCHDTKHNDSVALKVIRKIERYIDSAMIEADILKNIFDQQSNQQKNHCVKMFSSFYHQGYYVMVFERLGLSLYDLIKKNDYKRFPLSIVKQVSKQLLQGIDFLKSINLIHTDLKLENVLFVHNTLTQVTVQQEGKNYEVWIPQNTRIKIIDFGGATYDDDRDKATIINTRQYRGPEVTLELGWSFPSDIWSVGCIIAEIYCGDLLFQTHEEMEHLALMEKLCGWFPSTMVEQSRYRYRYFDSHHRVQTERLDNDSRQFLQQFPSSFEEVFSLSEEDRSSGIIELVRDLLTIDPDRRISANRALYYKFVE